MSDTFFAFGGAVHKEISILEFCPDEERLEERKKQQSDFIKKLEPIRLRRLEQLQIPFSSGFRLISKFVQLLYMEENRGTQFAIAFCGILGKYKCTGCKK